MTHTPGPWKYSIDSEYWWVILEKRSDLLPTKEIAHISAGDPDDPSTGEEAEDNCRLIAAAPEMEARIEVLEALNAEMLEALKALVENVPHADTYVWDQAHAAIAKAEKTDAQT